MVSDTDGLQLWRMRAEESWQRLAAESLPGWGAWLFPREPGGRWPVPLWPFSQMLWAASVLNAVPISAGSPSADIERLWRALRWYRSRGALVDNRPRGRRYFDDNAWLALVAAQQGQLTGRYRWWQRALAFVPFLERGCADDGGVAWVEGGTSRNACSTGSAGLLFAVLASGDAPVDNSTRDRLDERAEAAAQFLHSRLLRNDGLIADHLEATGRVEPSVWTYNQGLALSLFARTGHPDWAADIVTAVQRGLPAETIDRQPATFNAIWFRSLMAFQPEEHPWAVTDYLERAWVDGRDVGGLFTGVARYDDGVLIDHAAITGLMAAYAAPTDVRAALL